VSVVLLSRGSCWVFAILKFLVDVWCREGTRFSLILGGNRAVAVTWHLQTTSSVHHLVSLVFCSTKFGSFTLVDSVTVGHATHQQLEAYGLVSFYLS
jgi:hypothetical protein